MLHKGDIIIAFAIILITNLIMISLAFSSIAYGGIRTDGVKIIELGSNTTNSLEVFQGFTYVIVNNRDKSITQNITLEKWSMEGNIEWSKQIDNEATTPEIQEIHNNLIYVVTNTIQFSGSVIPPIPIKVYSQDGTFVEDIIIPSQQINSSNSFAYRVINIEIIGSYLYLEYNLDEYRQSSLIGSKGGIIQYDLENETEMWNKIFPSTISIKSISDNGKLLLIKIPLNQSFVELIQLQNDSKEKQISQTNNSYQYIDVFGENQLWGIVLVSILSSSGNPHTLIRLHDLITDRKINVTTTVDLDRTFYSMINQHIIISGSYIENNGKSHPVILEMNTEGNGNLNSIDLALPEELSTGYFDKLKHDGENFVISLQYINTTGQVRNAVLLNHKGVRIGLFIPGINPFVQFNTIGIIIALIYTFYRYKTNKIPSIPDRLDYPKNEA